MKHQISGSKLGRSAPQRNSLRLNLLKALFEHERIKTTEAKAKWVCSPVCKLLITKYTLMPKIRNCTGASTPCTSVQAVASRRARCAGVYKTWEDEAGMEDLVGWGLGMNVSLDIQCVNIN